MILIPIHGLTYHLERNVIIINLELDKNQRKVGGNIRATSIYITTKLMKMSLISIEFQNRNYVTNER